jgi:ribonuclease Z
MMTRGRRAALWALLIVGVTAAAAFLFQRPIGRWLFARGVEQAAGRDRLAGLPDGLHVALCGTGSPLPDRRRAGSCTVVIAGKAMFVVDAGEGGARNISLMGLPNPRLRGLFLTHFHSDHIDGMGPMMLLRWTASGNESPLPVHGPEGVEAVIAGFNVAYAADNGYRTAHHGATITPPAAAGAVAMPFAMPDARPAVGYRFDYKGRSVVISGDTAPSPSLEAAAKGADLLIHEALQPAMVQTLSDRLTAARRPQTGRIMHDILDYHASPAQAADSARRAGVRMLVLSHIVPPLPSRYFNAALLDGADSRFDGPIIVGEDGQYFSLPAGSRAIDWGSWF